MKKEVTVVEPMPHWLKEKIRHAAADEKPVTYYPNRKNKKPVERIISNVIVIANNDRIADYEIRQIKHRLDELGYAVNELFRFTKVSYDQDIHRLNGRIFDCAIDIDGHRLPGYINDQIELHLERMGLKRTSAEKFIEAHRLIKSGFVKNAIKENESGIKQDKAKQVPTGSIS